MNYRSEIDGLRAIAVVPVILFHAGFQSFSGGFIGVDVFFVISGYLITSIIIAEKEAGTFSLINFYERRARRILPAMFFVLLACLPFAWLWMVPSDLKRFSESLISVSIFASNIEFWRESGYFATDAELKPLLHTWSLAIEEQYYVLFPMFIILCWQFGTRWIIGLLIAAAIFSLAAAEWGSVNHPAATFYFLPTRGWELLVGGFIAFFHFAKDETSTLNGRVGELASIAGMALIAYAVFAFDKNTPFPSVYTLVPTLGTALLILFATQKTVFGRLLGSKVFAGIGLISYSAYLWHQPLFAFARLHSLEQPSSWLLASLAVSAIVFGYFTWRYIERPFRDKRRVNKKSIFALAALMSAALFSLGMLGFLKDGFVERLSSDERELLVYERYKHEPLYRDGQCFLEPEQSWVDFSPICSSIGARSGSVLLWGDSHAAAFSSGLRSVLPDAVIQYTASVCPPAINMVIPTRPHCKDINAFVLSEVKRIKPTVVVLLANWIGYDSINVLAQISKTIAEIKEVSTATKIVVVGGLPQWKPSLPLVMFQKRMNVNVAALIYTPLLTDLYTKDAKLKFIALSSGASFASALDALCQKDNCLATAKLDNKFEPIAWDYAHLTEAGSLLLAKKLLPLIISQTKL
jgi:peptidoglycan/LPS O-acetylase OafA/YrhL